MPKAAAKLFTHSQNDTHTASLGPRPRPDAASPYWLDPLKVRATLESHVSGQERSLLMRSRGCLRSFQRGASGRLVLFITLPLGRHLQLLEHLHGELGPDLPGHEVQRCF